MRQYGNGDDGDNVAHLTDEQRAALTDILRYNLEDRSDVLDDEEVEWLEERLEMAREESAVPVESGDVDEYQRFANEFALEVQLTVEDAGDMQTIGEFYEETMTGVVEAVRRAGGGSIGF